MTRSTRGRASPHFTIETLAPGVFAAIATPTGHGLCNAGIVDLGGQTVVFDSMLTPMAGLDLARAAERLTGRRPDWVVNSHWHGDHIWGNSEFVGAHVVSTHKTREVVLRKSRAQFAECRREFPKELRALERPGSPVPPAEWPRLRGWFEGVVETPASHRIVPPDVTFAHELVLEGSRRSLRLISYGGAHSPSDAIAFLPEERILFTGDLIMVGLHPSVSDGWSDRWITMLRRIDRLGPDRLLPGHGPLGSRKDLLVEIEYLRMLERLVAAGIRLGRSRAEICASPIPARFADWKFTIMFPDNLGRVYRFAKPKGPAPRRRS
jgi:cyclase